MLRKKLIPLLLSLCLIFSMVQGVFAIDINVPIGTTEVRIPVVVNSSFTNFAGASFMVEFTSGLTFEPFEWSSIFALTGMKLVQPVSGSTNKMYIAILTSMNAFVPAVNGDITIGELVFTYSGNNDETVTVSEIQIARLVDNDTVSSEAFGPFVYDIARQYSPYDLNKDGTIDLNDITWAMQYLLATPADPDWSIAQACDYNSDGLIDMLDLLLILANYTIPYYTP